ncbi:GerMN domain-containing protein [Granulicella tundricola]|uniref:Lipoprotein LpqB, GerMN domain protein n=1 Tax=Granulicella tundricola (strain ATCC BAA-1859 / DSM 23138 / MP5ACTX9) TaxID=1198114 RepID=E8X596_GRATM|nr:GerMN domain-containing protein [Granulicella tundricola]ADW68360.1 Lipoprotein LpqB, GerMN domain protein [Granulicella tundricola MP5ACTX9]
MIPKYQRIVYWTLLGGILLMALLLIHGCIRSRDRVIAQRDASPIAAPVDAPEESAQIATANDSDSTVTLDAITLPLPQEPSVRARILLDRLLADAALPASTHPLPPGPAIAGVFFLRLPINNPADTGQQAHASTSPYGTTHYAGSVLAVVDFTQAFADAHPSSIQSEDLTLRAIMTTLHANFPEVAEVRFLVAGVSRDTLAGHADLTRPYPTTDPATAIHPLAADGNPE